MHAAITLEEALRLKAACEAQLTVWARDPSGRERRLLVPDYQYVSDHSSPHRTVGTVKRVYHDDLPPATPRPCGSPGKAINDPVAIAQRVYAIWPRNSPAVISRDGLEAVRRRINEDGKGDLARSTFARKWPKVTQILNVIPRVNFVASGQDDLANVIDKLRHVGPGVLVRVGTFAMTLRPILDTLIDLHQNRQDVTIRALFDWDWCWCNYVALEGLVDLINAGIEMRHTNAEGIHMAVCIGNDFYFSGRASRDDQDKAEVNTYVESPDCMGACTIFDKYYDGFISQKTGEAQQAAQVPTAEEVEKLIRKAAWLRANPDKNRNTSTWSSDGSGGEESEREYQCAHDREP